MFKEVYSFICEILADEQLNQYIFENIGKRLTIINAGAQVTTPAVNVTLSDGTQTRRNNTNNEVNYVASFALPFFGADAFEKCLDFLDFVIPICFEYRTKNKFIKNINPSIIEKDSERDFWIINLNITVEVLN